MHEQTKRRLNYESWILDLTYGDDGGGDPALLVLVIRSDR